MQQAKIDTNSLIGVGKLWTRFHLAAEHDIPGVSLPLDRSRFDGALYLAMQLDFDAPSLREAHSIVSSKRVPSLWIRDAIIVIASLETWETGRFPVLTPAEEVVKRFLDSPEYILEHLRMNILVFFTDCLHLRQ